MVIVFWSVSAAEHREYFEVVGEVSIGFKYIVPREESVVYDS